MKLLKFAAAGTFALALAGCTQTESLVATIESATSAAQASGNDVEGDQTSEFELSVGECFNDTYEEEISEVPIVDCAEPHDNEIYYLYDIEGDDFPTDITTTGYEGCLPTFEGFVGAPYETSIYEVYPMTPTFGSWTNGDREVVCSVYLATGEQMTGTAAGTAQ